MPKGPCLLAILIFFCTLQLNVISSNFVCQEMPDGVFINKGWCSPDFDVCVAGQHSHIVCPVGGGFSQHTLHCEPLAKCEGRMQQQSASSSTTPQIPAKSQQELYMVNAPKTFNCTGRKDGYYLRAPCTFPLFACDGGNVTKLTCPTGLLFDPHTRTCEYPTECGRPSISTMESDFSSQTSQSDTVSNRVGILPILASQVKSDAKVNVSAPKQATRKERPVQLPVTKWQQRIMLGRLILPIPPNVNCENLWTETYKSAECSRLFVTCFEGETFESSCFLGLVYNPSTGRCEPSANVSGCLETASTNPSTTSTITTTPSTPPPEPNDYKDFCLSHNKSDGYLDDGCNHHFFACSEGGKTTTIMHCVSGLYYEPMFDVCDYKDLVPACGGKRA